MNSIAYPASHTDISTIITITCLILVVLIGVLTFLFINKMEEFRELKANFDRIMATYGELDEQAKLIVKTDLELNKAQEELDRRIAGMTALQTLARRTALGLNENEIFHRIDKSLMNDLGFSRAFSALFDIEKRWTSRLNIGFDTPRTEKICAALVEDSELTAALGNGQTFSSISASQKFRSRIKQMFDSEHFVLSPLIIQQKLNGVVMFGNPYAAQPVTEGDEELVAILGTQLAQSLENSMLFYQLNRSSQMLEMKVTERTRELSLALKKVEEISAQKSEFISAVSHELRTPLTSIKGYASILMTGKVGQIPDAVRDRLAKINTHSDNLVKLINDLLDISRIESGRVEMKAAPHKIKPIVDGVSDLLMPQLTTKGVMFKTNIPDNAPEIDLDQSQVDRVFINLISNAIKFTPPGGSITVNAVINWAKESVSFEVADTGIGIKKEDLARIFDEFFRVDNEINMNVKGTGLGLALAKNIVEAHFGTMWVTSEVGKGTSFHFTLPLKYKPREKSPSPKETSHT